MFLPCFNLYICLLCLPCWNKVNSKSTTAIFTSVYSTSMTFERMGQRDFASDRCIDVVVNHVTPHCRSSYVTPSQESCPYAPRTQCILLETLMVKIIRHSIAAETLWVRKVRYRYVVASLHTPHVSDRYSYRIAVSYAIEQRLPYVQAGILSFLWRMYGESKLLRTCGDFFKHV